MSKNSKKNKRKFDLKSAIALLLLLAIVLSASTYAWFTANRVVTVSNIDVHIDAKDGIQISADGITWKTQLTTDDITDAINTYASATNQLPKTIEPVSTVGDITSGKLQMYYGKINSDTSGNYTVWSQKIDTTTEGKGTDATATDGTVIADGKYIAFDIFLKVNTDQSKILLGPSSTVVWKENGSTGLQNAARVAFIKEGTQADGQASSVYQAISASSAPLATTPSTDLTATETYIWEPNCDSHVATAISAAKSYGIIDDSATQITESPLTYYGVNQAIAETAAVDLSTAMKGGDTTRFTAVTPTYSTVSTYNTLSADADLKTAFGLGTGVTKMRIYMWVEGQDVDCEDYVSGSDLTFNLEFKLPEA